jgi:hypothetical protein
MVAQPMSIKVWADGRKRVVGDWFSCAECGERYYKPAQTRKVCCDAACQTIRERKKRKARYQKQKAQQ